MTRRAILLAILIQAAVWAPPARAEEPPQRGMWVWHYEAYASPWSRRRLIEFCQAEKITLLLVQVHYRMDRRSKAPLGLRNPAGYGDLIRRAKEAGIRVEALEGDPEWSQPSGQGTFWPKLKVILDWNSSQPPERRFSGLHLDVEPYLLDDFATTHKWELLREYVEFMARARERVKACDPSLLFAADIPFWYDQYPEEDEYLNHCVVEFGGAKKPVSSHLQDLCDYIGIMSYRQQALGEDSITDISKGELAYAEKIGKRIFCGVETSDQDPPKITFYGTDPKLFREQVALVEQTFKGRPGFGGVLIHHYLSYREYLKSKPGPRRNYKGSTSTAR